MDLKLIGKLPVSEDTPAGSDAKYEPEFEDLQAEIDKLASPSATEATDWKKVAKLSSGILSEKSKDILVASYFAVSQIQQNNIEGLETGLTVYHDLVETYWENLFPKKKRIKGRINAIEWWVEKSETALQQVKPVTLLPETKENISGLITKIETLLNGYLPSPISLRPIERVLEEFQVAEPKKPEPPPPPTESESPTEEKSQAQPAPAPKEKKTTSPASSAPSFQAQQVAIETSADVKKGIDAGFKTIAKAAHFMVSNEPKNPFGYKFLRMVAWGEIDALPAVSDGKTTMIPPPEPYLVNTLKDLSAKKEYESLLSAAESSVTEYILWLDLTRYTAVALEGLGGPYEFAKDVVSMEAAFLLYRFPELSDFTFSDGMPFADDETREWLKSISLGGGSGMASSMQMATGDDSTAAAEIAETMKAAAAFTKKKKIREGVMLLQERLNKSASMREKLLWRIALCELLLTVKKVDIAVAHLEEILLDIDRFHLEEWNPMLALNGLNVVFNGFRAHPDKEIKEQSTGILRRISKINPAAALDVAK